MAADPQILACGPRGSQTWLCSTVFRLTDNQDAAEVADALARPIRIVMVLVLAWVTAHLARRLVTKASRRMRVQRLFAGRPPFDGAPEDLEAHRGAQRVETIASVLRNVVTVVIWSLATLIVLGELGLDLAPILAGAGVLGIVLGFGAQQVVRDYLAGMFVLLEDQYRVGDTVDLGVATGVVEFVSLRVTRIRDVEGVVWWVPNGHSGAVGNQTQEWSRAMLDVDVAYDTDVALATEILEGVAHGLRSEEAWSGEILDDPEVWGVERLGADSVVLRLVVKTRPAQQWRVARELRVRIKAAFDAAGIEIPFPQRTVTFRGPDAAGGSTGGTATEDR